AGAPGGSGQPPAKRGMPAWAWWVIGGGVLLLALIVTGAVLLFSAMSGGGAKGAADGYVSALAEGDIDRANELARVLDGDKRQAVLLSEAWAESNRATDFTIDKFQARNDAGTAQVSYLLDGSKLTDYIELARDGDGWYVSRGLTYSLPKIYFSDLDGYRIPGYDGIVGGDYDLEAYPGVYEMLTASALFELAEPVSFEVGSASMFVSVDPEFVPSEAYFASVNEQVKAHVDDCLAAATDAADVYGLSSCGLSDYYPSKLYNVTSFSVTVDEYPTVAQRSGGLSGLEIDEAGSAAITVKGKEFSGKSGTEKISATFKYLYFSTTVKGDEVSVNFY
ncbi:hypothetical protein ACFPZL_12695, partial [Leucobacter soli]